MPSMVAPARIYSSSDTTVSPFRPLIVTGMISSLNRPLERAASALFWLAVAKSVLLVSRDLVLLGEILGRHAHVIIVERVGQAVMDHCVDQG